MTDQIARFHFHRTPLRGHWVRLSRVWTQALSQKKYPSNVRLMLGEMLAITAMVSNNTKDNGAISLQSVGEGPINFSFAECRQGRKLRAIAQLNPSEINPLTNDMTFRQMMGDGKLALSLLPENGNAYQGLIELSALDIAQNVERYFAKSEQLETRILLANDKNCVTGCLWQRLPSKEGAADLQLDEDQEAWDSVLAVIGTITDSELVNLNLEELLVRLFPEHSIFLDVPKPLEFECTCSTQRTAQAIGAMSSTELKDILKTELVVKVTCEFCGKNYEFDEHRISSMREIAPLVH